MSRPDSINLYLYESTSANDLCDEINRSFEKSHVEMMPYADNLYDRPLKDSGQRRDFTTGSRRDVATGKGRFDLLPFEVMEALAKHYEKGATKYGDDNWKKGQPLSVYLDSGLRHTMRWGMGEADEDHLIAGIWNLVAAWWTQDKIRKGELPIELGDAGELKKEALTKKEK